MNSDADLMALFKAELELCKVSAGTKVAVLTQDNERADYAGACMAAARELGAGAYQVNVSRSSGPAGIAAVGQTALAGNRGAIESLKQADIVIDLIFLLFSPEQIEITDAGTRMLLVLEDVNTLRRRFPNQDLRRRVEVGEKLLATAKTLRITSKAGTDVTYRLGRYPVVTEYGFTDQPGRWDCWPSGFLFTGAFDDGVDGTVVLDKGDVMFAFRRYVENPIRLTIEKGYITKIDGEGEEAPMLRDYMASFNDPRAYAVSHIGWGLNEKANWNQLAVDSQTIGTDVLAVYGNVLFSTGPNTELGGSNNTNCHLDLPMRNCTLALDGRLIVQDGRIVHPEMAVRELA